MDITSVIILYAIFGLLCVIFSFRAWANSGGARDREVKLFRISGTPDQWQNWQLIGFVAFTLFPPVYLIAEWFFLLRQQPPSNLQAYEHKMFSDLWTALGVVLGALGIFRKP